MALLANRAPAIRVHVVAGWLAVVMAGCGSEVAPPPAPRPTETVPAQEPPLFLRPGLPVERELAGSAQHSYVVELRQGDFLEIIVDQRGVDVVVRLLPPSGPALAVDSPSDDLGPELVRWLATESGPHRLEVRAFPGPAGRYAVSLHALRPATAGDRARASAAAATSLAEALAEKGDEQAEAALRRAAGMWRSLGDLSGEAGIEDRLGRLASARGNPGPAAHHHRRAAALFAASGNGRWRGISLGLLGKALFDQGELHAAASHFEAAVALRRVAQDSAGEAALLHNLGHTQQLLGESGRALTSYERALELRRGRQEEASDTLHNLGILLLTLGRPADALDRLHEAEEIERRTNHGRELTATLRQIGRAEQRLGAPYAARVSFTQALELARRAGSRRQVALALSDLGLLERRYGALPAARPQLEEALRLFRELGDLQAVGAAMTNLGAVELGLGDPVAARSRFLEALPYLRPDGEPLSRAECLLGRARAELQLGDFEAARQAAEAAVRLLDSPRSRLGSLALTASYSAQLQPAFGLWIEALMSLHRRQPQAGWHLRALEVSERARARSYLDAVARAHPTSAGHEVAKTDPVEPGSDAEAQLRQRLNALAAERAELEHTAEATALVAPLEREIRRLLTELDRLERRRASADPRRAGHFKLAPLEVAAIQRLLPADGAWLELKLASERSWLWVVTPGTVRAFELAPRGEIEEAAQLAYGLLTRSHRREAEAPTAQALCRLSRLLLGPAAPLLVGRRQLLVVAEGSLLYLPWGALPEPEELTAGRCEQTPPLGLRHQVRQLPAASLLAMLAPPPESRSWRGELAVIAAPELAPSAAFRPLPYSREEAAAVLASAPSGRAMALLGAAASKEAVLRGELTGFRRLHFATHGTVSGEHPELAGLVLSTVDEAGRPRDGLLRAHEIAGLELPAELVVLSACRSGLGVEMPGEGLVGLSRSFFAAGARSLLVSLWSVDDRSTAELMRRFYTSLFAGGLTPAAALAGAQAAMAADPSWRAPYHWAGFVLQGPFDPPASHP